MTKVFISVGHGGSDPGAFANGLKEKDLNLVVALKLNEELLRHGITTLMSRSKDEEDNTKIVECNKFKPDICVDVHFNAGKGDGFEAFCSIFGNEGKKLAQLIEAEVKAIGQNSRGVKTKKNSNGRDYYAMIRETSCPTVILEGAFLDSADYKFVDTKAEQEALGVAYAKGILKYFGISYKVKEEPKPTSNKLYRVQVGAYKDYKNAEAMLTKVKAAGFKDAFIKESE